MGGGAGTPPLPALSPDPTPETSPSHKKGSSVARPDLLDHRVGQKSQQMQMQMKRYQDEMASQITGAGTLTADLESVLGG